MTDLTAWIWRWNTPSKVQNWFVLATVAWTQKECEKKVAEWAGVEQYARWLTSGEGEAVCVRLVDAAETRRK